MSSRGSPTCSPVKQDSIGPRLAAKPGASRSRSAWCSFLLTTTKSRSENSSMVLVAADPPTVRPTIRGSARVAAITASASGRACGGAQSAAVITLSLLTVQRAVPGRRDPESGPEGPADRAGGARPADAGSRLPRPLRGSRSRTPGTDTGGKMMRRRDHVRSQSRIGQPLLDKGVNARAHCLLRTDAGFLCATAAPAYGPDQVGVRAL